MARLIGNQTTIRVEGRDVLTLREILPPMPGLQVLFVAKTPAPVSVKAGHYFQGAQGCQFWCRLKEYGLLKRKAGFEDDSLLDHGYGLTDIARVPREYREEPSRAEYEAGSDRILELIRLHQQKIVVFIYKGVLDKIIHFKFRSEKKSTYGFNPSLEHYFCGARLFAFPLPGVGRCTATAAKFAMQELVIACGREKPYNHEL